MRTLIIGFVVFGLYLIPARWHYVCQIRQLCEDTPPPQLAATMPETGELPPRSKDLNLKVGDSLVLAGYEQFGFMPNNAQPLLSANNEEFLSALTTFLRQNPTYRLGITGFYYPDEVAEGSNFDNMGIARADAIRSKLMTMRLPEDIFKLDYQSAPKGESPFLDRPIAYEIIVPKTTPEKNEKPQPALAEASYTFNRMTFSDINFAYNSDVFNPSKAFNLYADSVQTYLGKNLKKALTIVGHADSRGADDHNYNLGLRRAENVRKYLINKGLDAKRIKAASEGEKQPIAPNDTEANMTKNRRVEVIIR